MERGQKSTPRVRRQAAGVPLKLWSNTLLDILYSLLLSCSWLWEGEVGIPAQPSQDWVLPQEPLWPGIPVSVSCVQAFCFPPETGLQCSLQHKTPKSSTVFHVVCACLFLKAGVSLPVPSWAPPSSRSHSGGDNEDKGGVSWWCMPYPPASVLPPLPLSYLPYSCLPLFSDPFYSEYLWPSATPGLWVPKEKEECEYLAGLQSIVLLYSTFPLSPPFSLSLSGACNPAEIQTLQVWFLSACFVCGLFCRVKISCTGSVHRVSKKSIQQPP